MVLTGDGWHSGSLNRNQCGMLEANRIPHVLQLSIEEIDFQVKLHYEITGKRMLAHVLKSEKMGQAEFYGLLLQITTALVEGKKYMLEAFRFLLEETYLFIEGSLSAGTVYLTYVPVKDIQMDEQSPALSQVHGMEVHNEERSKSSKGLLDLVMRLIPSVVGLEGASIQQIIKFCSNSQTFTYSDFRSLLLQLLEGGGERSGQGQLVKSRNEDMDLGGGEMRSNANQMPSWKLAKPMEETVYEPWTKAIAAGPGISANASLAGTDGAAGEAGGSFEAWDLENGGESDRRLASSRRTYVLLGAVLVTALGWKFLYLDSPGQSGLYLAAAITFAAGFISIGLLSGKLPFGQRKTDEDMHSRERRGTEHLAAASAAPSLGELLAPVGAEIEEDKHMERSFLLDSLFGQRAEHQSGGFRVIEYLPESPDSLESPEATHSPVFKGQQPIRPEAAGTADNQRQVTVLLSREQIGFNETAGQMGILERREKGKETVQRIELKAGSFVIGRTAEVVQFIESSPGTSRAHIEILVNHRNWRIKDLGSRNGTVLNGENMVPYKDYPLSPGDEFRIAGVSYKLCSA
ncbi:hypothetical protein AWM70_02275 [Paenibacillus yonginensis]|uniref:FHA domain-containing protein n=1 Tax=Paenibacillus yonginensis TaxID=1462996 RepID=A0A1B1MWJ4_9BACL|nr:DUF6382 domain-containing protein [Paenibacillus yonginensis]ANS73546.1 hypothetical protein AWM70_02275 [Paenibacillus yonginensis]